MVNMKQIKAVLGIFTIFLFLSNCSSEPTKEPAPAKIVSPPMEDIYTGATKAGKRHGKGTLIKGDGGRYVGEFKNGLFDGKGELTKADGGNYIGDFKNGEFHGKGKFTSSEGEVFEGEFQNGKFIKREIVKPEVSQ